MYTDKKADIHMFLKLLSGIKHKENSELVQLIVAFSLDASWEILGLPSFFITQKRISKKVSKLVFHRGTLYGHFSNSIVL